MEEKQEFWIADHERETLVEILEALYLLIDEGKVWFNEPGDSNKSYLEFINRMRNRFADMPVEKEN